jgi:hypothetical protein
MEDSWVFDLFGRAIQILVQKRENFNPVKCWARFPNEAMEAATPKPDFLRIDLGVDPPSGQYGDGLMGFTI